MTTSKHEQYHSAQELPTMVNDNLIRRDTRHRIKELEVAAQSPEIAWICRQMKIIRSDWAWSTAHAQIASGFLSSSINGRLFAYQDENTRLQLSTTFPKKWEEVSIH
jgi:hypothetical protein